MIFETTSIGDALMVGFECAFLFGVLWLFTR